MDKCDQYPAFLKLLASDPDTAFTEFYRFAWSRLTTAPPRPMSSLPRQEQEDLIQEVVYHCVKDDFRVLRSYRPAGRPFSHWLYIITYNRAIDYWRKKKPVEYREDDFDADAPNDAELTDIVRVVRDCINRLTEKCQLYLELAADEFKPKEMALALGLPADQNASVSDDLRYCRRKLRECVSTNGYDIDEVL